jgi:hypothetical protein
MEKPTGGKCNIGNGKSRDGRPRGRECGKRLGGAAECTAPPEGRDTVGTDEETGPGRNRVRKSVNIKLFYRKVIAQICFVSTSPFRAHRAT